MTVREAFEKAFGPLPEGVNTSVHATSRIGDEILAPYALVDKQYFVWKNGKWKQETIFWETLERHLRQGDISNRPASSFIGFFNTAYDKAVVEAEREVPK